MDLPHFRAMMAEHERTGLPVHFRNDLLVHDLAYCERMPAGNPFVWVIWDSGTHIISPSAADDHFARQGWLLPGHIANAFGSGCRFYAWDGSKLALLSGPESARDFLRTEFVRNGGRVTDLESA